MAKELNSKFWAKYFKVYDVLNMVIPYQDLLNTIVKEADIKKGDVVLDAGCGTGNLSMKLKKAGAKVFGVDYCIEALNIYRQKDPKAEMLVHDLTVPLPFADNYFDAVVCNNVLYALGASSKKKAVSEIYRVLKDGGHLVLSDPLDGFKIMAVYKQHIYDSIHKNGTTNTVLKLASMLSPTVRMIRYNLIIKKQNKNGSYKFSRPGENKLLLDKNRMKVSKIILAYANQSEVIKGIK